MSINQFITSDGPTPWTRNRVNPVPPDQQFDIPTPTHDDYVALTDWVRDIVGFAPDGPLREGKNVLRRNGRTLPHSPAVFVHRATKVGDAPLWATFATFADGGRTATWTARGGETTGYRMPSAPPPPKRERESDVPAALAEWDSLPATGTSAYLARKGVAGVPCDALRYASRFVSALLTDVNHTRRGVQRVHNDGAKLYAYGTAKIGAFVRVGDLDQADTIHVCEGLATGLTIRAATPDVPVVCALDAGNIGAVVGALRGKYRFRIVICADDDRWKGCRNAGQDAAHRTAIAHGCLVATPDFAGLPVETHPTDWNDLHALAGLDAVRAQLSTPCQPDARYTAEPTAETAKQRTPYGAEAGQVLYPFAVQLGLRPREQATLQALFAASDGWHTLERSHRALEPYFVAADAEIEPDDYGRTERPGNRKVGKRIAGLLDALDARDVHLLGYTPGAKGVAASRFDLAPLYRIIARALDETRDVSRGKQSARNAAGQRIARELLAAAARTVKDVRPPKPKTPQDVAAEYIKKTHKLAALAAELQALHAELSPGVIPPGVEVETRNAQATAAGILFDLLPVEADDTTPDDDPSGNGQYIYTDDDPIRMVSGSSDDTPAIDAMVSILDPMRSCNPLENQRLTDFDLRTLAHFGTLEPVSDAPIPVSDDDEPLPWWTQDDPVELKPSPSASPDDDPREVAEMLRAVQIRFSGVEAVELPDGTRYVAPYSRITSLISRLNRSPQQDDVRTAVALIRATGKRP